MPDTRLIILGIITAVLVLALVVGSAVLALGDSFRRVQSGRDEQPRPEPRRPAREARAVQRYTPERTRLRWYSPEIIAVMLLTLASGLWLARLVGG